MGGEAGGVGIIPKELRRRRNFVDVLAAGTAAAGSDNLHFKTNAGKIHLSIFSDCA